MNIFSRDFIDYLRDAATGPGSFRFILQPAIAILLGIRDGLQDARTGTPPFVYNMLFVPGQRRAALTNGIKAVLTPLCIGIIMDIILQLYITREFHPFASLLVGTGLIGLPYALVRGITNRIARGRLHSRSGEAAQKPGTI